MARGTKQLVEAALYGAGDRRRFTLDSPILSDVWAQLFEAPNSRPSLLLEPWLDTPAFAVAERLKREQIDFEAARITYNRTVIVADLSLKELVYAILPLTGWYSEIIRSPNLGSFGEVSLALPRADQMWEDLSLTDREGFDRRGDLRPTYPFPRLLGFIRMAGLVFAKPIEEKGNTFERRIKLALGRLIDGSDKSAEKARATIATYAAEGWRRFAQQLPAPIDKVIYSVTRNRPARLAIHQSVRTVKGDAASTLFSIDTGALTWAILDSGIDADHPAFAIPTNPPSVNRSSTRVRETYDFSYLRDLLTVTDWTNLPKHVQDANIEGVLEASDQQTSRLRVEIIQRIRRSRLVDWDLLRPFLRIGHDHNYVKPVDRHGTHVAGILACDWDRDGDRMQGMCPQINLIDIRVCRPDGTSDEFIIMSALQFVRHLNANTDRIAVHGVNMSLSLEHDASVYACGQTPVCEEAERTVASGVVVVAAAGNHGYRRILSEGSQPFDQYCPVSITDPGNAEHVITVGSTHRLEPHTYGVSYFSSRGPTGDGRCKPDLVAPGEKIFSPVPDGEAMRLDGTSMAAPHVSGAAALLMARHVELIGQPQKIKAILCDTATDLGRERYFQGRGLVDVLRAIQSI